jgi:hypothetical protein
MVVILLECFKNLTPPRTHTVRSTPTPLRYTSGAIHILVIDLDHIKDTKRVIQCSKLKDRQYIGQKKKKKPPKKKRRQMKKQKTKDQTTRTLLKTNQRAQTRQQRLSHVTQNNALHIK